MKHRLSVPVFIEKNLTNVCICRMMNTLCHLIVEGNIV